MLCVTTSKINWYTQYVILITLIIFNTSILRLEWLINQSINIEIFSDYIDCKSVISIMLIIPKDILFKQQQIMYNTEVTGSLFDNFKEGVSCINWPNYFRWFQSTINSFEVSDNRFQNLNRFPPLLNMYYTLHYNLHCNTRNENNLHIFLV